MAANKFIIFITLLFAAMPIKAQVPLDAKSTCSLIAIPPVATKTSKPQMPVMYHYPDHKLLPKDYSGCRNTWVEGGTRVMEAKFENGRIEWYKIGNGDVYCEYENDKVVLQDVNEDFKKKMELNFSRNWEDFPFCPPGEELMLEKWQ